MAVVVKAEHEGEMRRLLFETTPDYEALVAGLERLWPGCDGRLATYMDEDGDACTLVDTTFEDFLGSGDRSKKPPVLRLRLLSPPALAAAPGKPEAAEDPSGGDTEGAGLAEAATAAEGDGAFGGPKALPAQPAPPPLPELLQGALPGLLQMLQGARGGPGPASHQPGGEAAGGSAEEAQEKVYLILAAFDEDGDGRLNFQEWAALVQAAWGVQAPPMAYHFLCAHLGLDAQAGLDADDMARAYTLSGTLDWDFQAARRKLEGPGAAEGQAPEPPAEAPAP